MSNTYRSKRTVLPFIDMVAIAKSFIIVFGIRSRASYEVFGYAYGMPIYVMFSAYVWLCM